MLVVSGIYVFKLRKQVKEVEGIVAQYSNTVDSLKKENENQLALEKYYYDLAERNYNKAKIENEKAKEKLLK